MIRLLAASDRRATPWKNGGGVTREIAVFPDGAAFETFDWRISMAEVSGAGPFSRFDGIDRILTVLAGELALRFDGEASVTLTPGSEPLSFAGDAECWGAPLSAAVTDLNVMVRRGVMRAEVRHADDAAPQRVEGEAALVLALATGALNGRRLERFDAVLADGGETLTPETPFRRLVVDLYRV